MFRKNTKLKDGAGKTFCDHVEFTSGNWWGPSPDWNRTGWYRFKGRGNMMPEKTPGW